MTGPPIQLAWGWMSSSSSQPSLIVPQPSFNMLQHHPSPHFNWHLKARLATSHGRVDRSTRRLDPTPRQFSQKFQGPLPLLRLIQHGQGGAVGHQIRLQRGLGGAVVQKMAAAAASEILDDERNHSKLIVLPCATSGKSHGSDIS